jgi:hypothetical protein
MTGGFMRKGMKKKSEQNLRYIREKRREKNKRLRMLRTLKKQPNNLELRKRLG